MRKVLAMDATGLNALEDLHDKLRRRGKTLILSAPHTQPLFMMDKAGFLDRIGRENVCAHIDDALQRAEEVIARKKSAGKAAPKATGIEGSGANPPTHP